VIASLIPGAPLPGSPTSFSPPHLSERYLDNGMRVVVAPRSGVPLIGGQIFVPIGSAYDSREKGGLSLLTATALTHSSESLPGDRLSGLLDGIGARFTGAASNDAISFAVSALSDLFPQALRVAAGAIRRPEFASDEIERIRRRMESGIQVASSSASVFGRRISARALYGSHPYGDPIGGTEQSLVGLNRDDVLRVHTERFRPELMTLVLAGDITEEQAFALAQETFGDWIISTPAITIAALPSTLGDEARPRIVFVDMPDSGRSAVMLGRLAVGRGDPRHDEAMVSIALLSGYSGRLNDAVRIKRGLSYGATARLQTRREPAAFLASTLVDHRRVGETVEVMRDVLESVVSLPPTETELTPRKAMYRGSLGRALETISGLAASIGEVALYQCNLDEVAGTFDRIDAVPPERVVAFASRHLVSELSLIVVGDLANIDTRRTAAAIPGIEPAAVRSLSAAQIDLHDTMLHAPSSLTETI